MIVLGRVAAPFGIKGWVKIDPYGDDPLAWGEMSTWWLSRDADAADEHWQAHELRECRAHGNQLIVAFIGIDDRNAAETLRGMLVGAPRDALPAPDEDEYYWADLTGLRVINGADEELGTVAGLLSTGAHDVLRVVSADVEQAERLIPFVAAYVLAVERDNGIIRVDWQADW